MRPPKQRAAFLRVELVVEPIPDPRRTRRSRSREKNCEKRLCGYRPGGSRRRHAGRRRHPDDAIGASQRLRTVAGLAAHPPRTRARRSRRPRRREPLEAAHRPDIRLLSAPTAPPNTPCRSSTPPYTSLCLRRSIRARPAASLCCRLPAFSSPSAIAADGAPTAVPMLACDQYSHDGQAQNVMRVRFTGSSVRRAPNGSDSLRTSARR